MGCPMEGFMEYHRFTRYFLSDTVTKSPRVSMAVSSPASIDVSPPVSMAEKQRLILPSLNLTSSFYEEDPIFSVWQSGLAGHPHLSASSIVAVLTMSMASIQVQWTVVLTHLQSSGTTSVSYTGVLIRSAAYLRSPPMRHHKTIRCDTDVRVGTNPDPEALPKTIPTVRSKPMTWYKRNSTKL